MSALPVYIWYPAQFVNSTAFVPDSLSEAENLVLVFEGKPAPQQVDTTPFVNLARHIAAAAQDGEHSDWFAEFYRDIETTLASEEVDPYYFNTVIAGKYAGKGDYQTIDALPTAHLIALAKPAKLNPLIAEAMELQRKGA